ncbi:TPA: DNA-directed RNA polymerase subunit beta [Streptococcus suis]
MDKENLNFLGKRLFSILIVVLLAILVFAVGLMVGYGVIGDGDNVFAILSPIKWQELMSKFTGK